MIQAKPVIPNQYWILTDGDKKVGQLQSQKDGYEVKILNKTENFRTIPMVKKNINITFETIKHRRADHRAREVNGYPTDCRVYNAVYDVQKKLPLYTKQPKSKSWYAAGWYLVKNGSRWVETFCPKLLVLKRTQYAGPVKSPEDLKFK